MGRPFFVLFGHIPDRRLFIRSACDQIWWSALLRCGQRWCSRTTLIRLLRRCRPPLCIACASLNTPARTDSSASLIAVRDAAASGPDLGYRAFGASRPHIPPALMRLTAQAGYFEKYPGERNILSINKIKDLPHPEIWRGNSLIPLSNNLFCSLMFFCYFKPFKRMLHPALF